jgi:hypothetical protein
MKSFDQWQNELDESLSLSARMAVGRRMKRFAPRIARAKKIKQRRMADRDALTKRSVRAAKNIFVKKLMAGKSKADLSFAQRKAVEDRLKKKSGAIQKLSKKLFPKIRKSEVERLKSFRSKGQETSTPGQTKKL